MAAHPDFLRSQLQTLVSPSFPSTSNPLTGLAARCFGAGREIPLWLLQPSLSLQALGRQQSSLATRLAAVRQTVEAIDDLFAAHLPEHWSWFQSTEAAGMSPHELLPRWVDLLVAEGGTVLRRQLLRDMADRGTLLQPVVQVDEYQRAWLHRYFMERIYPLLTPLAVDPGHPFPFISSASVNLLVELRDPDRPRARSLFARVKIPATTPAWIRVPTFHDGHLLKPAHRSYGMPLPAQATTTYVWSADLVRFFVHHLFTGMPVRRVYLFRVVRGETPLPGGQPGNGSRHRRRVDRPAARLDVERRMDDGVVQWLGEHLCLPDYAVARHDFLTEWLAAMQVSDQVVEALAPADPAFPRFNATGFDATGFNSPGVSTSG